METKPNTQNRMILLLIAGIPLTMILAATWLWYFVISGDLDLVGTLGTANRGTLLQPPRQMDDAELFTGAQPFSYMDGEPQWTLLVPVTGDSCAESCERSLYVTRQIHIAMGKDFNRIDRMLASDRPADELSLTVAQLSDQKIVESSFADFLRTEHRGLDAIWTESPAHEELFSEYQLDTTTWYLVDPRGWVMMSYTVQTGYKDVISDLKFLLKNSSE